MPYISFISLGCFILTIGFYLVFRKIYMRYRHWWLMPLLPSAAVLIVFLWVFNIHYDDYYRYNHALVWFLGPVTVAYAAPFYEFRRLIKQYYITIIGGSLIAVMLSVGLGLLLSSLIGAEAWVQKSFILRSISTPFALAISDIVGSDKGLSILFIMIHGVFANITGLLWFHLFRIRSTIAQGVTWGSIGHALATVKAFETSTEHGVLSSLSLILSGVITMLFAPLFLLLF